MDIALTWWQISAGGSRQAIRGNVRAFEQAGHDVDLYLGNETDQLEQAARNGDYDAVVMPYIHYHGDWSAYENTHVHLQLGGYPAEDKPALTKAAIENADTVSALDPTIVSHFQDFWPLDPSKIALVPNPPNRDLFARHPRTAASDHVLVPKLGSPQKAVDELAEIAAASPTIEYHALYTGDSPQPPHIGPNVLHQPSVPFTQMPNQYRDALVVANPSKKDVLPNTAFEAWLSGRPYVCRESAIGYVQSIPAEYLNTNHWGKSVVQWYVEFEDEIGTGEHYIDHDDNDAAIGESVHTLATNPEKWERVVSAADDWLDAWGDWDWQSKGEALTAVINAGGPLKSGVATTPPERAGPPR
jgi:glycosyltransferase involved in cell wall biosynthesis